MYLRLKLKFTIMRINVYLYTTIYIYIIVTTIGTRVTFFFGFFFFTALVLDIKTILLGIERKTNIYNNINIAIETCMVFTSSRLKIIYTHALRRW